VDTLSDLKVLRNEAADCAWELVQGNPDPRLQGYVHGSYNGWTERTSTIMRRREVAKVFIPLIINLGPRFGVLSPGNATGAMESFGSFVAGLHDCAAITEAALTSHCIQVNLTPLGAYRLLGLDMETIANRVVELDAIMGPEVDRLIDRLYEARTWSARFALVDATLLDRIARGPAADPRAMAALRRLGRAGGRVSIGAVADELELSRKQLIALFHRQIGFGPKAVAEMIRFDRALRRLERGGESLSTVALDCGYYDQPHFNREFRRFAGVTPGEFLDARLPDDIGLRDA
jgi:AraC-like DNA-binding protein